MTSFSANANFSIKNNDGIITLSNGLDLRLSVAPEHGGEISGIQVKNNHQWHELIHRGNDYSKQKGWRGKSQLLWPATGPTLANGFEFKNKKLGNYLLESKLYDMPFHGFAKDQVWTFEHQLISDDKAQVTLSISDTDLSRKFYPFKFKLSVTYTLFTSHFEATYKVHADKSNTFAMPFSIGNHITFKAPLIAGGKLQDFMFESFSQKQLVKDQQKFPTGAVINSPYLGKNKLADLPERQSVSLTQENNKPSIKLIDPSGLVLTLSHQASKLPENLTIQYNLWASIEQGFISPEPWVGSQNSLNSGLGLIKLKPSENWTWTLDFSVEQN
ncbi:hypothetical protein [Thalassomonas sp. M1454]|uniref:aldose epimerase family protein n=1 Tax=Thalassomonas sp. M1454 TaxID=2594477 RepID=UPI00163D426A|nr:hypothetical protein [Thalassomonas sp. M1454]